MALRLEPVVEQEYCGYCVKATACCTPSLQGRGGGGGGGREGRVDLTFSTGCKHYYVVAQLKHVVAQLTHVVVQLTHVVAQLTHVVAQLTHRHPI